MSGTSKLLKPGERRVLQAVAKLSYCNPFLPERIDCERELLGGDYTETALAWNLKAWFALSLPETAGRWQTRHRADKRWLLGLELKTFVQAFVRLPSQLIHSGRRLIYRLLSWNPHQHLFFRVVHVLRC